MTSAARIEDYEAFAQSHCCSRRKYLRTRAGSRILEESQFRGPQLPLESMLVKT